MTALEVARYVARLRTITEREADAFLLALLQRAYPTLTAQNS